MTTTELFVSLKMPDNTAITAFHTLKRIGYDKLRKLERQDYYKFEFSGNLKSFQEKISKVDILVNTNKHKYSFNLEINNINNFQKIKKVNVLIQNLSSGKELLSTLKARLGFKNIKKVEKGILWILSMDAINVNYIEIAEKIAKDLLMNENYQKMTIFD